MLYIYLWLIGLCAENERPDFDPGCPLRRDRKRVGGNRDVRMRFHDKKQPCVTVSFGRQPHPLLCGRRTYTDCSENRAINLSQVLWEFSATGKFFKS